MERKRRMKTKSRFAKAVLAGLTIFMLTSTNFFIVGKEVWAAAEKMSLNNQTEDTLNRNVKFDTYFMQNNEKTHYLLCDVNGQPSDMYINLSVKEGYLRNAYIKFSDRNYTVEGAIDEGQLLQEVKDERIDLKQINADPDKSYNLILKIGAKIDDKIKLDDLSSESKVIFRATHIDNEGKQKEVVKEVKLNVGFIQKMSLNITQNVTSYFGFTQENEKKVLVKINAKVKSLSEKNNLPIKETVIEAEVPRLNGALPESANIIPKSLEMTSGQKDEKIEYSSNQVSFNKEQGRLSIRIENKEKDGKYHTANGEDEYAITYIYPVKEMTSFDIPKLVSNIKAKIKLYTAETQVEDNQLQQMANNYENMSNTIDNTLSNQVVLWNTIDNSIQNEITQTNSINNSVSNTMQNQVVQQNVEGNVTHSSVVMENTIDGQQIVVDTKTTKEDKDTITGESNYETYLIQEIGKQISLEVTTDNEALSKGKMYANTGLEEKIYETEYNLDWKVEITNKEALEIVRVEDRTEYFIDEYGKKFSTTSLFDTYTHYIKTTITKNNFERLLGEEGVIKIYNQSGELITQINKETQANAEGQYIITYPEKTSKIILETSKPISEGTLYVKHVRAIEKDLPCTKEQIRSFLRLETQTNLVQVQNNNFMTMDFKLVPIVLEETNTNANIVLDKTTLSTLLLNENVEIKIELDNNRKESDLYQNPVFLVELPEYIENIDVKSANVLYDDKMEIAGTEKIELNGKTYIKINLTGTQDGFSTGSFTKGTNIVLKTDIRVKLLTPSKEDSINLYYINPNAITYKNAVILDNQVVGMASQQIAYSAPKEMVAVSNISNYDNTGKTVTSIKQGKVVDKIGIYENSKIARMDLKIVNNTGNTASHVVAFGRIPFQGNKSLSTNEDLGTTMDAVLKSAIVPVGIDPGIVYVFYSEKGDAEPVMTEENGWTLEPQDLSKVKSFIIILNNYEMPTEKEIDFSYDFEIPANLEHENEFYGAFEVSFVNNDTNIGIHEETIFADTVGLTTGEGPKLEVSQNIITNGIDAIRSGEIAKIRVNIKNTSLTDDLENVYLREYIPKYTKYTVFRDGSGDYGEYKSGYIYPETKIEQATNRECVDINIGEIPVGQSIDMYIQLEVQRIPNTIMEYYEGTPGLDYNEETDKYYLNTFAEGTDEIISTQEITGVPEIQLVNQVAVFAKDLGNALTSESIGVTIKNAEFSIKESSSVEKSLKLEEGEELIYNISIENVTDSTKTNVKAMKTLPSTINYKHAFIKKFNTETSSWENDAMATYHEDTRTVEWNIGELGENEEIRLNVYVQTANLPDGIYEKDITTRTIVYADNVETHYSAEVLNIVAKPYLVANIKSDAKKEYISEGDKIQYTVTVKNEGKTIAKNVTFEDKLPAYLQFQSGTYTSTLNNNTGTLNENNNTITLKKNIEPGEVITIVINASAKSIPNNKEEVETVNYATFDGENIKSIITDSIKIRIEQSTNVPNPKEDDNSNSEGNNNGDGNNSGNSGNSGNNNGKGSTNDNKTYRIRGTAWVDTNANGERDNSEQLFEGLKVVLTNATTGEIVKDKDSGAEKTTTTAKDGTYVFENLSKGEYIVVFYHNTGIYGVTDYRKAGVADNINSDVISKIVSIGGETKEAAISDTLRVSTSSFANIDIGLVYNKKFDLKVDKVITRVSVQNKEGVKTYNYSDSTLAKVELTSKNMVGSTVVAEYKIKIKNEGNMAGYAKNIVDYMPKDMKFNSGLNPNWYAGNDGNLYSTQLTSEIINPGETKEIELVLTKQVTDTSSKIINNLSEVYEDYNELGIADVDSRPNNKAQNEDDIGSADLIIGIKTGGAVIYTTIIIVVLGALAGGIYILRKRKAKNL